MLLFILIVFFLGSSSSVDNRRLVDNGTHYLLEGIFEGSGFVNSLGTSAFRSQAFSIPLVKLGTQFYLFSNYFQLNFFEAFRFCEDFGLNLMSVETKEESKYILEFLKKQLKIVTNLWTSGQDLGKTGEFSWLANGNRINNLDWERGHPFINETFHCIQAKKTDTSLKFVNSYCWSTADFLCEMKSCPPACVD